MRWCDKPHEWQEMLDLSVKPKLTDEDEERLIDLQAMFGTGGEKESDRFAGIYDVLKGDNVVLQSTADIASDYIGVTRERFHSAARRNLGVSGFFNGYTVIMSEMTADEYTQRISKSINEIVRDCGMTMPEFSRKTGVPSQVLNNWLSGSQKPSVGSIRRISKFIQVPIADIMNGTAKVDKDRVKAIREKASVRYYDVLDDDGDLVSQGPIAVVSEFVGESKSGFHDRVKHRILKQRKLGKYYVEMSDLTDAEYFDRIYSAINTYRVENDMTMNEFLTATGISASTFRSWRSGKRLPTISSLERMADQIGISVADLVRGGSRWG